MFSLWVCVSLLAALNRLSVINLSQTIIFLAKTIIWNPKHMSFFLFFFSMWVFFHEHSRIIGLQGKEEGITPHYYFHLLHRHLDMRQAITAESSPLHIASSRTWTGNLWFIGKYFCMENVFILPPLWLCHFQEKNNFYF